MQKLLVPVLVLTTVALSSSNVLPIQNELNEDPSNFNYQDNDNTFSSNHQTKNKLNAILFNVDVEPEIEKTPETNYRDNNEDLESITNNDNYYDKGYRKEQWHNYPRQLDRLNRYFYQHQGPDKRNLDPDESSDSYEDEPVYRLERSLDDMTSKELLQENDLETRKINNEAEIAAAVINPLLIFRIHLACYNKNVADNQSPQQEAIELDNDKLQDINKEENGFSNEMNPEFNLIKVKREGKTNLEDESSHVPTKTHTMNKRIFALFSRLQSLSPKGHQLHHRRHLYALYGPPDSEGGGGGGGGGVLTAETRATFMRPPGSPLRWG